MAGNGKLPFVPWFTGIFWRTIFTLVARVKVIGLEKLPQTGPLLMIVNHCSNADGMLLVSYVVPALHRPMGWLGKAEALRWPFFGWAMKHNGVLGVRRGAGDLEAFKMAKGVLDNGGVLTIFPEGTRSRTGGIAEAKEGATVLAVRSGAPIVPIAIAGSHRFWGKGKLLPRPFRHMTITIGDAFTLEMPKGADRRESMRQATAEMMGHIAALLPEDQRGVYGGPQTTTEPA